MNNKPTVWNKDIIKYIRIIYETAQSHQEVVKIIYKKFGIKTNTKVLEVITCINKIKRPFITANYGGDRRSGKIKNKGD